MTILAEFGITDGQVEELKGRGVRFSYRMEPVARPLISDSPDWWVYATDLFTPPLSSDDRNRYISSPDVFCDELLSNLDIFSDVCDVLLAALDKIEQRPGPVAQAGAYLSVLRVFQSSMDVLYYKFDRHFDYQQYEESPVGHYWLQLNSLCLQAAIRADAPESDKRGYELALSLLRSFKDHRPASTDFLRYALELFDRVAGRYPLLDDSIPIKEILAQIRDRDPKLYESIERSGQRFRKSAFDLLETSRKLGRIPDRGRILAAPLSSNESEVSEELQYLDAAERGQLDKAVAALVSFQLCQEEEPFRFYGLTKSERGRPLDVGFKGWQGLTEVIDQHQREVSSPGRYAELNDIMDGNPIQGTRRLLHVGEEFFSAPVRSLYEEELRRWADPPTS